MESADQLFVHCHFSLQCWYSIMDKLSISFPLRRSLWDLFQPWPILFTNSILTRLRIIVPSSVICSIWCECNKRILRKEMSNVSLVISTIERLISEQVNNMTSSHFNVNATFSSWDSPIVWSSKLISFLSSPVFPHVRKNPYT